MERMNWITRIALIIITYVLYSWAWNQAFADQPDSLSPTFEGEAITRKELGEQLRAHIHYNHEGKNTIGHIVIGDKSTPIGQSTWLYVKSCLDYYKKNRPAFIILELNTPGGEVFAAMQISDALKNFDIQEGIPVVAYINNWAISAGAMLAYSCRFIAVVKDASMGAAEPITEGATGQVEAASEKVNSAIRTDFANRAGFFDRNPLIGRSYGRQRSNHRSALGQGRKARCRIADQVERSRCRCCHQS